MKTMILDKLHSFSSNLRSPMNRPAAPSGGLFIILPMLACFAFLPGVQAVCQEGCDSTNFNVFLGDDALVNNTAGSGNTAIGWRSLFSNTDASFNTGVGGGVLAFNNGTSNTGVGTAALLLNTVGTENTAVGTDALVNNDTGGSNTAIGVAALPGNMTGDNNTALGHSAGYAITTGNNIIAIGELSGVSSVFGQVDDSCYIDNIYGAIVDFATVRSVIIDADGKLGTMSVDAAGNKVPLAGLPGGQREAMLNEKLEKLQRTIGEQEKQIVAVTAQLKEQAAQIQKVSAQLQQNKSRREQ